MLCVNDPSEHLFECAVHLRSSRFAVVPIILHRHGVPDDLELVAAPEGGVTICENTTNDSLDFGIGYR